MPAWPSTDDKRTITLELSTSMVEHLDARAAALTCSRAAILRQLIIADQQARQAEASARVG